MTVVIKPGDETTVNTVIASNDGSAQSATLADGSYIVVWQMYISGVLKIHAQRFSSTGVAIGSEHQINTIDYCYTNSPTVTGLADGGYVVAWGRVVGGNGIFQQRYDANGDKVGGEVQVNTYTTLYQENPGITALNDGGWFVTWQSQGQDGNSYGAYGQRYNASGTAIGGEVHLTDRVGGNQDAVRLASLTDGGFIVVFEDYNGGIGGYDVYAQRYDAAGAKVGDSVRVNLPNADYSAQYGPQVVGTSDGGYLIVWQSNSQDGPTYDYGYGVYTRHYDANGTATTGEIQVNTTTYGDQMYANVAVLSGGGYVVVWESGYRDMNSGPMGNYIYNAFAQVFDADGNKVGDEIRVNTFNNWTYSGSPRPDVTALSDNRFVVTWLGRGNSALADYNTDYNIYQKTYTVATASAVTTATLTTGAEDVANSTTADSQINAAVAALSGGGYVVTWQSLGQDGELYGVFSQSYTASGVKTGSESQVNATTALDQSLSRAAGLSGGGYVVAWTSNDATLGNEIRAQRYDASGAKAGSEILVNTYTTGAQAQPDIAGLSSGGFVVVWMSYGQDASNTYGIYTQRYNASGVAQGSEVRVNTYTANAQVNPHVAALSDGGYIVVWASTGQDGAGYGIFAQRYNASGVAVAGETMVNSYLFGDQNQPVVAGLSGGGYVVAWQSAAEDGSGLGVYLQRFDASGHMLDGERRVNTYTTGDQSLPVIAALGDGGFVVAWQSAAQDGSGTGIYAQRYDANGDRVGSEALVNVTTDGSQSAPAITATADGGYVVSWHGLNAATGSNDIYQRFFSGYVDPAAGDTTYVVSDANTVITEGADQGTDTVQASVSFALPANVENLTLTGTADIDGTGNDGANTITGNSGANRLDGGAGADSLSGGLGNDTYVIDNTSDTVNEDAAAGTDTVEASVTFALAANVENLTLTDSSAIDGTGNDAANAITGNGAANRLDGGLGDDSLAGGAGDDTYVVDSSNDAVSEATGEGSDTVTTALSACTLSSNVENLVYTGSGTFTGTGNDDNNALTGGTGNDTLSGGLGNDALTGGAGNDSMSGGAGNDTYYVDSTGDIVVELTGEGTDTVVATASYTLAAEIERLTLSGSGALNGTGNELGNIINGNSGNNVINGAGGADTLTGNGGTDTFYGGGASDVYNIDSTDDVIVELANEGSQDTVNASASYALSANVEKLILTGSSAINGTGNELANTLTGNGAANTLSGGDGNDVIDGGLGNDILVGGIGDDKYTVDSTLDVVTEGASEGTDTVTATASYTLSVNVENLTLGGTAAIDATGNESNNTIIGNSGNNVVNGAGGADTLTGGGGTDTFYGGGASDVYNIDSTDDVIVELANEGSQDTVNASASYTLSANVEKLILTGSSAINGTGNELANTLTGNGAANTLNGGDGNDVIDGGLGDDSLVGGAGDDKYTVDSTLDVITEQLSEGTDTVTATASYTLSANIETLTLSGTAAIDATGNESSNTITGNSGNNVINGAGGADTLTGNGGTDTFYGGGASDVYNIDSTDDVIVELANEGSQDTVNASATYALSANIEKLILGGTSAISGTGNELANTLTGNSAANTLSGGDGNDVIDGGLGDDSLAGGTGDDKYYIDSLNDTVTEQLSEGTDTVYATVSRTLAVNVENLVLSGTDALTGTGNDLANSLTGNSGNNVLTGGGGADTLTGGGGTDTFYGGGASDVYYVDSSDDVVVEYAAEGSLDTINASVTCTLGAELEKLVLTGTGAIDGTGNELSNTIIGNSAANLLTGGAGNDAIDGGAGADTLVGGTGNDAYTVDNTGDVIAELTGEGTDTVTATATYTLSAEIEKLTLGGTAAIDGTGNDLANTLTGNSAANALSGGAGNDTIDGGAGDDAMSGGSGDDKYYVDSTGDTITEQSGEGTDTVYASATYTLSANVETLTLTGSGAVDGTGNDLANTLTGNSGNNSLSGGDGNDSLSGGGGKDTMIGGTGNDAYTVDSSDDIVTELTDEGYDSVTSSVTWTLGDNVEKLVLSGSAAIDGIGNDLANSLTGNSAINILSAGAGNDILDGGLGDDSLTGGSGDDKYYVDSTGDLVVELADGGSDTVRSSVTWTLGDNFEILCLTGTDTVDGTGNALNNSISGNTANNGLTGGDGNDALNGGVGNDTLNGGAGNDSYTVDSYDDVIIEAADGGLDQVTSSLTWTLASDLEKLSLSGTDAINGTGNELANTITGNAGANCLTGGDGNDSLNGGLGNDTLIGGTGNDVYYVDSALDIVSEVSGEGSDVVYATVTYALSAEIEKLSLTGTAAIDGTGNDLANSVAGNSGNNTLYGGGGNDALDGGLGDDTVYGGTGDDKIYVDSANDVVIELYGEGTDTVRSAITWTLGDNIENLCMYGTGDVDGTGNALNNTIGGTAGNNRLDGGTGTDTLSGNAGNDRLDGGYGADLMTGGVGDDSYYIDSTGDRMREYTGGGHDVAYSSVTYTLSSEVDELWLTGTAAINATGNDLSNTLSGNSGDNSLTGGLGADLFVFAGSFGHDTITDFSSAQGDSLSLDTAVLSLTQSGSDAVITLLSGDSVTVLNTLTSDTAFAGLAFVT